MRRIPLATGLVVILLIVASIGFYSLRYISAFELKTIELSTQANNGGIPTLLKQELGKLVGTNLFKLHLALLQRQLGAIPSIQSIHLSRLLPSTLKVQLALIESPVVIEAMNEKGEVQAVYLVHGKTLEAIPVEDETMWTNSLLTVEIPPSYATLMQAYGVDADFDQVMALSSSLKDTTSLITRIKYDNNSSNSFGKMVLELSSLNAQIWVREPVGVEQVRSAVALVVEDQKDFLSFLSSDTKRYDLYRAGMVRR